MTSLRFVLCAGGLLAMLADRAAPQGTTTCRRPPLQTLRRLVGHWDVDWRARAGDSMVVANEAQASILESAEGCAVIEQLTGRFGGRAQGLTTMIVAPSNDSLQMAYVDTDHGGLTVFAGADDGRVVRFVWRHDWGDHVQSVRREYSDITPSSFVVETWMTPNDRDWTLVQRARYRRSR